MSAKQANQVIRYLQVNNEHWEKTSADVIVETPVSLTVNGEMWLTFMCTPIDLEAMAAGFLYNEGLIASRDEIVSVRVCDSGDNVDVWLTHSVEKPDKWRRTSGCTGGVTAVEKEDIQQPALQNSFVMTPKMIGSLISQLFEAQDLYQKSGGVHTSALSDGNHLYVVSEDIGRHNTLDKIAGRCLLENISLPHRIIITTGRISSEMIQKSARLGAVVVISRTSPSSLSIEMADMWGIMLIGYARRGRFNVYTHEERLLVDELEKT